MSLKVDKVQLEIVMKADSARVEIQKLEDSVNTMTKSLKKMEKGSVEYARTTNKIIHAKEQIAELQRQIGITGMTLSELSKRQKELNLQLRNMDPRSEKWSEYRSELDQVNNRLRELRGNVKQQDNIFSKSADWINRYVGIIGTGIAALTGISMAFNKLRDERNKLEESTADLEALTGLQEDDINWLEQQAMRLSTTVSKEGVRIRQSTAEIIEAFKLVGSAKPELLSNKEALAEVTEQTLILASASGMKLTEAVDGVTLAMNQYSANANEAARYTNVLAAGSKMGAAAVKSQTATIKNSGVAAAAANIPIEQLVGTIETLAEKGIKDEVAGTGLKKFFLTLQTGADETNPKVVGLEQALANLSKQQLSAAEIKKIFGEEGYNVASVLINEADRVKYFTEVVTDTTIAMEQAVTKSRTAEAKQDQARNKLAQLGVEFVDKFNPAILAATNGIVGWMRVLVQIVDWLGRNTGLVISAASALAIYTAAIQLHVYWKKISNGETLKEFALRKQEILLSTVATAKYQLLAAAKALLTGNVRLATATMRAFLATLGINPIIAAGIAITAIAAAIYKLYDNAKKSNQAIRDMNVEIAKESYEANSLFDALKKANSGSEQRKKLIDEINAKYGSYLKNQLTEHSTISDIATALEQVNKGLKENAVIKAMNKENEEVLNSTLEKQVGFMDTMREKSKLAPAVTDMMLQDVKRIADEGIKSGDSWKQSLKTAIDHIDTYYNARKSTAQGFWINLEGYIQEVYLAQQKLNDVTERYSPFLPQTKTNNTNELPEVVATAKSPNSSSEESISQDQKIYDQKLKAIENYIAQERLLYSQQYMQGEIDKRDYLKRMEELELESLRRKLTATAKGNDDYLKLSQQLVDAVLKSKEYLLLQESKLSNDSLNLDSYNAQKKADITNRVKSEIKSQLTYEKLALKEREAIVKKEKADMDQKADMQRQLTSMYMNTAESFGSALGDFIANSEAGSDAFLKRLVIMALDTLDAIVNIEIAKMTATSMASPDSVYSWGTLGLKRSLILAGIMKAAVSTAKAVVSAKMGVNNGDTDDASGKNNIGYSSGGWTGSGGILEVAGPVHRGEYVVPAWQMQDPVSINYVKALESIRGTRSSENKLPGTGFANGGFTGDIPAASREISSDVQNAQLIKVLIQSMRNQSLLTDQLKDLQKNGVHIKYGTIENANNRISNIRKRASK